MLQRCFKGASAVMLELSQRTRALAFAAVGELLGAISVSLAIEILPMAAICRPNVSALWLRYPTPFRADQGKSPGSVTLTPADAILAAVSESKLAWVLLPAIVAMS